MNSNIDYKVEHKVSLQEFVDLLNRSTLGQRRPLHDIECITGMVGNASLWVTAWDGTKLVGLARTLTDFTFACYLSELAVDEAYQRKGIGRALIVKLLTQLGPHCKIRLIAAPAAAEYYQRIGFVKNDRCWELGPKQRGAHCKP